MKINYNLGLDIEVLDAEINININGIPKYKFLYFSNEFLFITFKFKECMYEYEDSFYDFRVHDKLLYTSDYFIIFINPSKLQKFMLYQTTIYLEPDTKYLFLVHMQNILKKGINTDCSYIFNSLNDINLQLVNMSGYKCAEIYGIISEYVTNLKKINTGYYNVLIFIKSNIDYFDLIKYIGKFPNKDKPAKLEEYIKNLIFNI